MRKPSNDFTLEIAMKVNPCCSLFSISIVAQSNVSPCDLCIVRAHAIFKGICLRLPLTTGVIGTSLGFAASKGTTTYMFENNGHVHGKFKGP